MKPKILVIDDEAIVLESCRRIFSNEGYEITTADDARIPEKQSASLQKVNSMS